VVGTPGIGTARVSVLEGGCGLRGEEGTPGDGSRAVYVLDPALSLRLWIFQRSDTFLKPRRTAQFFS